MTGEYIAAGNVKAQTTRTPQNVAPHGKTTMAPQLWQRQLGAGAWGIAEANAAQLIVARHFGVTTLLVANPVLDPIALRRLGHELSSRPIRVLAWADSVAAVE